MWATIRSTPTAHIGLNLLGAVQRRDTIIEDVLNFYVGIGGGIMIAAYTYQNDTAQVITPALDVKVGVNYWRMTLDYTVRFAVFSDNYPMGINNKISVGIRIPY